MEKSQQQLKNGIELLNLITLLLSIGPFRYFNDFVNGKLYTGNMFLYGQHIIHREMIIAQKNVSPKKSFIRI
jgi:hypothetical protein